jgi:ATPase subunit of ABC transporter with duplicated ATPase domains
MALVRLSRVTASIGARQVFTVDAASLEAGQRVGLVGPNGVGKSTLLSAVWRQVGGAPEPDGAVRLGGRIEVRRGVRAAYVPQVHTVAPPAPSAVERARWSVPSGAWETLSGGQRTRWALAVAFALRADLLILDEPTNHLDAPGMEMLDRAVSAHPGAVLAVSHDRQFLERAVTEIWELDRPWQPQGATLRRFSGSWSDYRREAERLALTAQRAHRDDARRIAHLRDAADRQRHFAAEAFAHAGVRDPYAQRGARLMARKAKAAARRLAQAEERAAPKPWRRDAVGLPVSGTGFGGRALVAADGLRVGHGGEALLVCPPMVVQPRARIAVVGPNGAGKTALLRTLARDLGPVAGTVWHSPGARPAFVGQEREGPAPTAPAAALLGAEDRHGDARTIAAELGLRGERSDVPFAHLSGGERTAVALAMALVAGANLLFLDEPTNHLDLYAREAVERALAQFPGAVVMTSHDRWLVGHWAQATWRVEAGRPGTVVLG